MAVSYLALYHPARARRTRSCEGAGCIRANP
jgi:hypothetical protein